MSVLSLMQASPLGFDPKGITSPVAATPTSVGSIPSKLFDKKSVPSPTDGPDIIVTGSNDTRVRIAAGINNSGIKSVLGDNDPTSNILSIMYDTNGLLFPYTPTLTVSQSVNWDAMALVQSNWDVNAYQRTPSVNISLAGIFTAQNKREGEYLMAVLHFLRTVTKSYYGDGSASKAAAGDDKAAQAKAKSNSTNKAGIPPPVLYLYAYGDFMFKSVPVVIKSYNYGFDEVTDSSIFTSRSGYRARLPAKMQISIELGMQMNSNKARTEFDLDLFRTGKLLGQGGWF